MTASAPLDFRKIAALVAAAGTLFWLYTFYAIAHVPGDGFQWLAVFPLGMIFALFFLPAWLLVAINKRPGLALAVGLCGLIAFAILWVQLLNEFPKGRQESASSAASRSASAMSSTVLALKNGSSGAAGQVTVASG
jgi:hypothetical protein